MSNVNISKLQFSTRQNFHRDIFYNEQFTLDSKNHYWTIISNSHHTDIEHILIGKSHYQGDITSSDEQNVIEDIFNSPYFAMDFFKVRHRIHRNKYRIADSFFSEIFKDKYLQLKQRERLFLQDLTSRMDYWKTVLPKNQKEHLTEIEKLENKHFYQHTVDHLNKKEKIISDAKRSINSEKAKIKISDTLHYLSKNEFKDKLEQQIDAFKIQKKELIKKYKKDYKGLWNKVEVKLAELTKKNNDFVNLYSEKKRNYRHELDTLSFQQLKKNHKTIKKLKREKKYFDNYFDTYNKQLIEKHGPEASISEWKKNKVISFFEANNFKKVDLLREKYDSIIEEEFLEIVEAEKEYNEKYSQKIEDFFLNAKIFRNQHFTHPYRLLKYKHKKIIHGIDDDYSTRLSKCFENQQTTLAKSESKIKSIRRKCKKDINNLEILHKNKTQALIKKEKELLNNFYVKKPPKEFRFVFSEERKTSSSKEFGKFYKGNSKLFSNQQKRTFNARYKKTRENFYVDEKSKKLYNHDFSVSAYDILEDKYDHLGKLFAKAGVNEDFLQTKADTINSLWLSKISVIFAVFLKSKMLVINLQKFNFKKEGIKHEFEDFLSHIKFLVRDSDTKIVFISKPENYQYVKEKTDLISVFYNGLCLEQGLKNEIQGNEYNKITKCFLNNKSVPSQLSEKYEHISARKKQKLVTITNKHQAIKNENI